MAPEAYWQLYSDYLIHRIHSQVLEHIKHQSEQSVPAASTAALAPGRLN